MLEEGGASRGLHTKSSCLHSVFSAEAIPGGRFCNVTDLNVKARSALMLFGSVSTSIGLSLAGHDDEQSNSESESQIR